jgi:multiple sugar transport system permease protein
LIAGIDRNLPLLFPMPAVLLVLGLAIYPIVHTLIISTRSYDLGLTNHSFVGTDNYEKVLASAQFWSAFLRTAGFTALSVAASVALGMVMALVLNRDFRGARWARTAFLLPMVATPVATSLVWMMMFNPTLGILNYILAVFGFPPSLWVADPTLVIPCIVLVDVWHSAPFAMIILLAGLRSLPREPLESAMIDGASRLQIFRMITLPMLKPVLVVVLIFRPSTPQGFRHHLGDHRGGPGTSRKPSTSTRTTRRSSISTSGTVRRSSPSSPSPSGLRPWRGYECANGSGTDGGRSVEGHRDPPLVERDRRCRALLRLRVRVVAFLPLPALLDDPHVLEDERSGHGVPPFVGLPANGSELRRRFRQEPVFRVYVEQHPRRRLGVGVSLLVGLPAAYAMARHRQTSLGLLFLLIKILPGIVFLVPLFVIYRQLGMINTLGGVALSHVIFVLPLVIWIMIGFFEDIPRELEEAALIDGCSRVGIFLRIVLPLSKPGIVAATILVSSRLGTTSSSPSSSEAGTR